MDDAGADDYIFLLSFEEVLKYFGDDGQEPVDELDGYFIDDRFNKNRDATNMSLCRCFVVVAYTGYVRRRHSSHPL